MMRALIIKDLQINLFPLLLAGALLVFSPVAISILTLFDPILIEQSWERRLTAVLCVSGLAIHVTAQLSLAILSANMIAVERVDRSAEFLAYLPPNRGMILRAKATVLGVTALVLFLIPLGLITSAAFWGDLPGTIPPRSYLQILLSTSSVGICAAGIGWMGSSTLNSNAVAILFALIGPVVPGAIVLIICSALGVKETAHAGAMFVAACLATGSAGFLIGTRTYLQRNEL